MDMQYVKLNNGIEMPQVGLILPGFSRNMVLSVKMCLLLQK